MKNIDATASSILTNAEAINGSVNSINATASALLPVVQSIHGTGGKGGGGVEAINIRAAEATGPVAGIQADLAHVIAQAGPAGPGGHVAGTIHGSVNGINCAVAVLPERGVWRLGNSPSPSGNGKLHDRGPGGNPGPSFFVPVRPGWSARSSRGNR